MDRERTTPKITRAVVRQADSSWCEEELAGLELPDGRMRQRAIDSLQRLSEQPSASIPEASGDWAATKGTYGLFEHETVTHGVLLAAHREQTIERMQAYERVLVIQDSSYVDIDPLSEHGGSGSDRDGETERTRAGDAQWAGGDRTRDELGDCPSVGMGATGAKRAAE